MAKKKKINPNTYKGGNVIQDGNIFRDLPHDVYFYNDAWKEYTFYREDEYGFRIEPVGRGATLEDARANYEAGLKANEDVKKYA